MRAVLDLLVPPVCDGCGAPSQPPWCAACDRAMLATRQVAPCAWCAGPAVSGHRCWAGEPPVDALVALGSWTGGVAAAVARAKLVARREVLRAAGERIGLALAAAGHVGAGDGAAAVVAVPSDRRRSRRRGGDHTAALAAGAAAALGVPVVRPFAPARGTTDRVAGGGSSNRPVHVDVPPVARPAVVADADLVVVDDVVTTGATIAAVAHALRAAGARRVVAGVVGRAGARSLVGAPQERP